MARTRRISSIALALATLVAVGAGCAPDRATPGSSSTPSAIPSPSTLPPPTTSPPTTSPPTSSPPTTSPPTPEPRRSFMTIPRLGLTDYPVIRYRGSPDDAEGTRLQNDGSLASPRGEGGGTAPGEIGNFIVTGHRLSSTEPFRYLPSLPDGSRVWIRVADTVHVYEVRRTRQTSFRSTASLAAQRAPVPGRPGVEPRER